MSTKFAIHLDDAPLEGVHFHTPLAVRVLGHLKYNDYWNQAAWRTFFEPYETEIYARTPAATHRMQADLQAAASDPEAAQCGTAYCAAGWIGQASAGVEWMLPLSKKLSSDQMRRSAYSASLLVPLTDARLQLMAAEDPEWYAEGTRAAAAQLSSLRYRASYHPSPDTEVIAKHVADLGASSDTHMILEAMTYGAIALGFHPAVSVPLFEGTLKLPKMSRMIQAAHGQDEYNHAHLGEMTRLRASKTWAQAMINA